MNINRVVLTGNLTRDPEVVAVPDGPTICKLGIAVNGRRKSSATGTWEDKANYFRVTVFGRQAETCAKYLAKGRRVAVEGHLHHSEWEAEDGSRRQKLEVIARSVEFLDAPRSEQSEPEPAAAAA